MLPSEIQEMKGPKRKSSQEELQDLAFIYH